MADLATPAGTPAIPPDGHLPPDVTALLTAVRDALDIPISHWDDKDERAHHRILSDRASVARIALDGILRQGHDSPATTAWLIQRVAMSPITYRLYEPEQAEGGEPQ